MNIHIHPVSLDHASRVLKCLESAGRSGCFSSRTFMGAGPQKQYQYQDAFGAVHVQLFPRASGKRSGFVRKALATLTWTRKVRACAEELPASCVNVHGLSTLALGVRLKRHHGCTLIYDTHELETKTLAVRGVRRLYSERLERALIHNCDAVICVSEGIADWYAGHYGITRPLVVRNVADRRSQTATTPAVDLRTRCGVPTNALLFLYQGGLAAGRQIEQFIQVFANLSPNHHLIFLGRGELEDIVHTASANHANIHYHPAVPPGDLLAYTAQADIGFVGMENTCLNHWFSLPNKLFECLAAGVPVIVPDFPEMRRVVDNYHCGWSWSGDAEDLAALIRRLSPEEIKATGGRARTAGRELSWEKEEQKLLSLYQRLFDHVAGPERDSYIRSAQTLHR